ncbi:fumarylacetoacetase [Actinophytocola sediminis]
MGTAVSGSWVHDPAFAGDQPFGPQTLPYGVVDDGTGPRVAVRLGDHALPLPTVADELGDLAALVTGTSLDPLLAATRAEWSELRARLTDLVTGTGKPAGAQLLPLAGLRTRLPFTVGDYVDFYCSRHHAENVGRIMRPDGEPLLPNWTHLPVGYHGRSSTIVVSGTDVVRPHGQRRGNPLPHFGPTGRLDVEAEVGFVCGGPVARRVPTANVAEHIFGVVLVNDWSARDIQGWESQPLGPFLGKSFATSVSAWVTPLDALAVARVPVPDPGHPRLPYLVEDPPWGLDLRLAISWNDTVVSRPQFADMAYSCAQQLAHMTVNGAIVRPGDLFASGTVSGAEKTQRGCFLELSWGGREQIALADGSTRTFLEDGDTVVITAQAPGEEGTVVGIAEVAGTVLPAED